MRQPLPAGRTTDHVEAIPCTPYTVHLTDIHRRSFSRQEATWNRHRATEKPLALRLIIASRSPRMNETTSIGRTTDDIDATPRTPYTVHLLQTPRRSCSRHQATSNRHTATGKSLAPPVDVISRSARMSWIAARGSTTDPTDAIPSTPHTVHLTRIRCRWFPRHQLT